MGKLAVRWLEDAPEGEAGDVARRIVAEYASAIGEGRLLPKARTLSGRDRNLRGIVSVRSQSRRFDVRVYMFAIDGVLWVLHVDPAKRRTVMIRSTVELLVRRRSQLVENARRGRGKAEQEARV